MLAISQTEPASMNHAHSAHAAMLAALPQLRAFAISLCRNRDYADDLAQETLLRAWRNIERFEPGSSMTAWLITILRNHFYSDYRKRRREVDDADGIYADTMAIPPSQMARLQHEELRAALDELPDDMREALILVTAAGYSYPDAARICGCALGTLKSRVHRARARLAQALSIDRDNDLAEDPVNLAIVARAAHGRYCTG